MISVRVFCPHSFTVEPQKEQSPISSRANLVLFFVVHRRSNIRSHSVLFFVAFANDVVLKKSKNCLNAEVQATRKYKERKNLAWAREGEREEAVVAAWRHAFDATDPPSSK